MNTYKIKYYTSGGYKASGTLETKYEIRKNAENELCIFNGETRIGGIDEIEQMFTNQLGHIEDIMLFDAIKIEN